MTHSNPEHRFALTAADTDAGARLDRFLSAGATDLSRSRIKNLIETGHVRCGAATITEADYRVKPGEVYVLTVPAPEPATPEPQAIPLEVVYEDTDLIVVDKPAGLVVHPAAGHADGTLVNALLAHCGDSLSGIGGVSRPGIVHRLDKDTSGLLVAAKTDAAHRGLARMFERHNLERVYRAFVWGVPAPTAGRIEGPIGRDRTNRKKMAVVKSGGKQAVTDYRVSQAWHGLGLAELSCRLHTGRTHQIRVHLSAQGHPVFGDPLYGRSRRRKRAVPESVKAALADFPRQALHAATLGFRHPCRDEQLSFSSPLPADMAALRALFERENVTAV